MDSRTLQNVLYDFLHCMNSGMAEAFTPLFSEYGLTPMQARLLFQLDCEEILTVGQVRRLFCENSGNTSTLCKRMESAGFLRRERSRTDERKVELHLTTQGKQTLHEISEKMDARCAPVLEAMRQEELDELDRCIQTLFAFVQKLSGCENIAQETRKDTQI